MFEIPKIIKEYEGLTAAERTRLLKEKSEEIFKGLAKISDGLSKPSEIVAGFILGSTISGGEVSEKDYLLIYPALLKIFGDRFDFSAVKKKLETEIGGISAAAFCKKKLTDWLSSADDGLRKDLVMLCLCAMSVDGRISPKKERYVLSLIKPDFGFFGAKAQKNPKSEQ